MIFHDKYELAALRGGDQEIAVPGREIASGRDVLVHLLAAGYTPENREVLAAIDKLTAEYRLRILDTGDHEGIPYVITDVLPANLKLREWLTAVQSAVRSPGPAQSPVRSGAWKIPPAAEATPKSGGAASEPGEFTRLFQAAKPTDLATAAMAAALRQTSI